MLINSKSPFCAAIFITVISVPLLADHPSKLIDADNKVISDDIRESNVISMHNSFIQDELLLNEEECEL